jgi:hypothetical protein
MTDNETLTLRELAVREYGSEAAIVADCALAEWHLSAAGDISDKLSWRGQPPVKREVIYVACRQSPVREEEFV